jgi:hypothetical protein
VLSCAPAIAISAETHLGQHNLLSTSASTAIEATRYTSSA